MKLEIINPSDKCYLDTEDIEAAACATLIISNGQYGLRTEGGEVVLPIILLHSEEEIEAFWKERFGHVLSEFAADLEVYKRLADACDTFYYEGKMSSLTNIGKAFKDFGEGHREKAKED